MSHLIIWTVVTLCYTAALIVAQTPCLKTAAGFAGTVARALFAFLLNTKQIWVT